MQEEYAATAASKPSLLLMGEAPRLIDEWQDTPVLWNDVLTMVDEHQILGQFILDLQLWTEVKSTIRERMSKTYIREHN